MCRIYFDFSGRLAAVFFTLILLGAGAASAQQDTAGGLNQPGRFDFYLPALFSSPSHCAALRERGAERMPQPQCSGRLFSFVVHALWPQYERGYQSYCQRPAPRIDRALVDSMLDLMPSPRLVYHDWNRHGTCSGLGARAYFDAVRKAGAAVKAPPKFLTLAQPMTVTPGAVEDAFLKANPG